MLDQIDKINWAELGYPQMALWLHNLASDNPALRTEYINNLFDNHVNDLSVVSPYVIPFLIELLAQDSVEEKVDILTLLMQLASEASVPPIDAKTQLVLSRIEEGTDLYLSFLEKPRERGITFELLGYLRGRFEQITSKFLPMLGQEENKAPVLYTFYKLFDSSDVINEEDRQRYSAFVLRFLSANETDYVRFAAAALVSRLMKANAPSQVDVILEDAMRHVHNERRAYTSSISWMSNALLELGVDRSINILIAILPSLSDSHEVFEVLTKLLNLGFNNGKVVKYSQTVIKQDNGVSERVFRTSDEANISFSPEQGLSSVQQRILLSIVDHTTLWSIKTNLLQLHGLPSSREELRKLLA